MIRKLNIGDIELVKKILPPSKIDIFVNTYLMNLKTWFAFGFFKDGEIKGISTSYYNSGEAPEWYMLVQYADCAIDMEEMIDEVCRHYESQEVYKLFWLDADFYIDFMENFIPVRYLHFREYSLNPFSFAKTPKHHNILYNHQVLQVASRVYMSVLSNEHRKL